MKDLQIGLALASQDEKDEEKKLANDTGDVTIVTDIPDDDIDGVDSVHSPLSRGYAILEEDLPVPYKENKYFSKFKYYLKSCVVTNPRLFSLFLLYKSMWPRALVIVDMFTDFNVAFQLFNNNNNSRKEQTILFTLSVLFLMFPFIMVWATSLRFVQQYINDTKKEKNTLFHAFLLFYLFPPIGCFVVTIYEILYVFYDIIIGMKSFMQGTILIIDKDPAVTAFKQFRKVIQFLGVSLFNVFYHLYTRNIPTNSMIF